MIRRIKALLLDPYPLRTITRSVVRRMGFGSYELRLRLGVVDRPHYGYCVYQAASLAKRLGHERISVLEFGVAGGDGLVNLEYHAREASRIFSIEIDVYGFDTGAGLPEPVDYRDLPYHWKAGFYKMDVAGLRSRLERATLVLGDVRDTAASFFETHDPAPIGAISYDLDFYSSTEVALAMLEAGERHYLPRVFCYFDDTIGSEVELYNDFIGVRLAINEFNEAHPTIKIGLPYYLRAERIQERWFNQVWVCHFFEHSQYGQFVSEEDQQLHVR